MISKMRIKITSIIQVKFITQKVNIYTNSLDFNDNPH